MLHQLIRYKPVIESIGRYGYASALEVGSGSSGLARFVDMKLTGVDIDFMDYTGERQGSPANLMPVMADAAKLPFADDSFGLVFSCDMLEHVPKDSRSGVVAEMVRVAYGRVVLVFPCGSAAAVCDGWLRSACIGLGRKVPGWLDEHVGLELPHLTDITDMLDGMGLDYRTGSNGFLPLHYALLVMESIKIIRSATEGMSRRAYRDGCIAASVALAASGLPPAYRAVVEITKR